MTPINQKILIIFVLSIMSTILLANVLNLDKGISIKNVKLYPSVNNLNAYYYLPNELNIKYKNEKYDLLILRYFNPETKKYAGILQCILEFKIHPDTLSLIEEFLQEKQSNAYIAGVAPIKSRVKDLSDLSFGIWDKELTLKKEQSHFTINSNSDIPFAISLNEREINLLHQLIQDKTTSGQFKLKTHFSGRRKIPSVRVNCDFKRIYKCFSVQNQFNKKDILMLTDSLFKENVISIENIENPDSRFDPTLKQKLIESLTSYMIDRLFELDERLSILDENKKESVKYFSLKDYDINEQSQISFKWDEASVFETPLFILGSLPSFDDKFENCFKDYSKDDALFSRKEINCILDPDYKGLFDDNIFSSFSIKIYNKKDSLKVQPHNLFFSKNEIAAGKTEKRLSYAQINRSETIFDSDAFEYKMYWQLYGSDDFITIPKSANEYLKDSVLIVAKPELERHDLDLFISKNLRKDFDRVQIKIFSVIAGQALVYQNIELLEDGFYPHRELSLYCDIDQVLAYQLKAIKKNGQSVNTEIKTVDSSLLNITSIE